MYFSRNEVETAELTASADPSKRTILIVEDDREIRQTLKVVLEAKGGIRALQASNGLEAQFVLSKSTPDLIILDIMMPKKGGYSLLEWLNENTTQETCPRTLVITLMDGERHKKYSELLGADDYLRKPFAMEVLLETVDALLNPWQ